MNKKIAICVDAGPFLENRIFDANVARKYPGAESTSVLAEIAQKMIQSKDANMKN